MKRKKHNILSVFLSFCMIVSCMVGMSLTAGALYDVACVIVDNQTLYKSDFADAVSEWNSAENGATLKLLDDVTTASTINVSGTKTLDLNGKTITGSDSGSIFKVTTGNSLTITGTGILCGKDGSTTGGSLLGSNSTGSDVYIQGGTFILEGGTLTSNYGTNATLWGGSAVGLDGGTFRMTGGELTGNEKVTNGVVLIMKGTFEMTGGSIHDNNASGVFMYRQDNDTSHPGSFNMSGGSIYNNTSGVWGGGGVKVEHGTFTMSGGEIHDNKVRSNSNSNGGGVLVSDSGSFNVSGNSKIYDNKAKDNTTKENVYLMGKTINVSGALGTSASIGVTMQTVGEFTNSTTTSYNDKSKFTSDNAEYSVLKNADGQLYLGNHSHIWYYSASGDTITATCNGTGTCDITPSPTVKISAEGKTYDGTAVTATVTKSDNWTTENGLTEPGTITYSPANSANAGTYTASVTVGTGTGAATAQVQFTISPKTVSAPTITLSPESYTYDGTAKKPTVTVADGTTTIDATEYTVSYSDNTNAGTATVTITDKDGGSYTVSGSKTFTINKASQSAPVVSSTNETIEGKADGTITGVTTAMEYKLSTATVYTAVTGTTITGLAAGTYNVRYAEDANHEASPAADVVINTGSKLTVQFDADGGTPEPAAQQLTYGQKVTKPETDPTKTGYTFKFWSADGETEYDFSTELTANITLKAIYDVNKYKLYFDYAGGGSAEYNVEYGEKLTDYIPTISQEGYTFLGWDKEIPETMPANDLSFTAQWKINQYTITFNTNGGTEIAPITQDYGTAVTSPADPTKTGYTFDGWDKAIPTTMPAEDMTITAQWTINQYTITFDTDGGTAIAPITQDYGTAVTAPADPTKTGYTFAGWDKAIPTTMPAEDMTITAKWTINQYTISFNTNGGSEIAPITQDYGTPITAPANPTRPGYTFTGWSPAIPATMPAENLTVYAQWNSNTPTYYIPPVVTTEGTTTSSTTSTDDASVSDDTDSDDDTTQPVDDDSGDDSNNDTDSDDDTTQPVDDDDSDDDLDDDTDDDTTNSVDNDDDTDSDDATNSVDNDNDDDTDSDDTTNPANADDNNTDNNTGIDDDAEQTQESEQDDNTEDETTQDDQSEVDSAAEDNTTTAGNTEDITSKYLPNFSGNGSFVLEKDGKRYTINVAGGNDNNLNFEITEVDGESCLKCTMSNYGREVVFYMPLSAEKIEETSVTQEEYHSKYEGQEWNPEELQSSSVEEGTVISAPTATAENGAESNTDGTGNSEAQSTVQVSSDTGNGKAQNAENEAADPGQTDQTAQNAEIDVGDIYRNVYGKLNCGNYTGSTHFALYRDGALVVETDTQAKRGAAEYSFVKIKTGSYRIRVTIRNGAEPITFEMPFEVK